MYIAAVIVGFILAHLLIGLVITCIQNFFQPLDFDNGSDRETFLLSVILWPIIIAIFFSDCILRPLGRGIRHLYLRIKTDQSWLQRIGPKLPNKVKLEAKKQLRAQAKTSRDQADELAKPVNAQVGYGDENPWH